MQHTLTVPPSPVRRRLSRQALLVGATLAAVALGIGVGTTAYLGQGPAPITVTDTSGGATFNFRVGGIPVPGKIEGVRPQLTFSPRDLGAARGVVSVDLVRLNTGIALRDKHARTFLGVAQHPTALFTLNRLEGASVLRPGQTLNVTARGTLQLNGTSVPLQAPTTLSYAADGSAITVTTAFDVTFRQHHIAIPGADPKTDVRVVFRLPTH